MCRNGSPMSSLISCRNSSLCSSASPGRIAIRQNLSPLAPCHLEPCTKEPNHSSERGTFLPKECMKKIVTACNARTRSLDMTATVSTIFL